jgi:hypothetical protein
MLPLGILEISKQILAISIYGRSGNSPSGALSRYAICASNISIPTPPLDFHVLTARAHTTDCAKGLKNLE